MSGETWWQRLACGVKRVHQRPDWVRFAGLDWMDHIMVRTVTDHFHTKQGRSTGRLILKVGEKSLSVYLKRHYRLPFWRGLMALLWPGKGWSPAVQEWNHLQWARAQGMPVPNTVAAGEYIGPWGRFQSFLAVEELANMIPLDEAIPRAAASLSPRDFTLWKRGLIEEMVRLTRSLHSQYCFHKDLYLCHFFIHYQDAYHLPSWKGRVHLIDLHRLGRHRLTWRIWQVKDLAQLLYSSDIIGITTRDRFRFWKTYLKGDHHSALSWVMRRAIIFKWRRYQHHNGKKEGERDQNQDRD